MLSAPAQLRKGQRTMEPTLMEMDAGTPATDLTC